MKGIIFFSLFLITGIFGSQFFKTEKDIESLPPAEVRESKSLPKASPEVPESVPEREAETYDRFSQKEIREKIKKLDDRPQLKGIMARANLGPLTSEETIFLRVYLKERSLLAHALVEKKLESLEEKHL